MGYSHRWIVLFAVLVGTWALDLASQRAGRNESTERALGRSVVWAAVGLGFCAWIGLANGRQSATQFLAAYLLEESLSLDNFVVFLLIFRQLHLSARDQRRVLAYGLVGSVVARGVFIALGVRCVERWNAVLYVLGGMLVVLAVRMASSEQNGQSAPSVLSWFERRMRVAPENPGAFFVRVDGRMRPTVLVLASVAVEFSDVLFAVDSVPSAFAVTESPFILYSSNVFAVVGQRALFLLIGGYLSRLSTLRWGLSAILALAGTTLLTRRWIQVSPATSVVLILVCIGLTVVGDRARRARAAQVR